MQFEKITVKILHLKPLFAPDAEIPLDTYVDFKGLNCNLYEQFGDGRILGFGISVTADEVMKIGGEPNAK